MSKWRVKGHWMEPGPRLEFRISVLRPGYVLDPNRLAISPRTAAKLHPEAFLAFAADVADAALKLRAERSQLEMDLEVVDD